MGQAGSVRALAKLTLSLRVTGVRPDGYHLLDAEMVTLDLADTLLFGPGEGVEVVPLVRTSPFEPSLITRALEAVGRQARAASNKSIGTPFANASYVVITAGPRPPRIGTATRRSSRSAAKMSMN